MFQDFSFVVSTGLFLAVGTPLFAVLLALKGFAMVKKMIWGF